MYPFARVYISWAAVCILNTGTEPWQAAEGGSGQRVMSRRNVPASHCARTSQLFQEGNCSPRIAVVYSWWVPTTLAFSLGLARQQLVFSHITGIPGLPCTGSGPSKSPKVLLSDMQPLPTISKDLGVGGRENGGWKAPWIKLARVLPILHNFVCACNMHFREFSWTRC